MGWGWVSSGRIEGREEAGVFRGGDPDAGCGVGHFVGDGNCKASAAPNSFSPGPSTMGGRFESWRWGLPFGVRETGRRVGLGLFNGVSNCVTCTCVMC